MIDLVRTPIDSRPQAELAKTSPWRVSVIIPAYRAAKTIGRAVQSVLNQTLPAHEILIVDDGSPDEIAAAIRPYRAQVQLIRQANGGAARARNTGIENASGELIAFLDADDYWEPTKLESHVRLYEKHPHLGLTCSRYFEQEPGSPRQEVRVPEDLPLDCETMLAGPAAFNFACRVSTVTVVVPRRLLRETRFTTELKTAEDRDLWIRLATAAPVYYLSRPLATAVLEPDSLSRSDIESDCANMLRVVRAYRDLLGRSGLREWESHVFRRWAGVQLAAHRPRRAIRPALAYLRRNPLNLRGWWVLLKSAALALTRRPSSTEPSREPG